MSFMKAVEQSEGLRGNLSEAGVKHCNSISFVKFELLIDVETDVWDSRGAGLAFELTYKTDNSTYMIYK